MPIPGWYVDPSSTDRLRLWDGAQWCEDTRPWALTRAIPLTSIVMDERRSWLQMGSALAIAAVLVALLGMTGRSVDPATGSGWATGGLFDQTIIPVGMAVTPPLPELPALPPPGLPSPALGSPAREPPAPEPPPPPAPMAIGAAVSTTPLPPAPVTRISPGPPRMAPPRQAFISGPVARVLRGSAGDYLLTGFRWNPCRTITVATSGPPVAGIVAELASITGLSLKTVSGPADIVVTWGPIPIRDAIGLAVLGSDGPTIVHAIVTIARRGAPMLATVLRHEMGHALGLGHAKGSDEIMYPVSRGGAPSDYQAGDLAGLRTLGSAASRC